MNYGTLLEEHFVHLYREIHDLLFYMFRLIGKKNHENLLLFH